MCFLLKDWMVSWTIGRGGWSALRAAIFWRTEARRLRDVHSLSIDANFLSPQQNCRISRRWEPVRLTTGRLVLLFCRDEGELNELEDSSPLVNGW